MNQTRKELLKNVLEDLNRASKYLHESSEKCTAFANNASFSKEELESLEALTARFARLVDMLFKRAYRTILFFEFEDAGTYIDMLNKAAKRDLISSMEEMAHIKDIRNMIAHEYASRNFDTIIKEVLHNSPFVISLVNSINSYCKNLLD